MRERNTSDEIVIQTLTDRIRLLSEQAFRSAQLEHEFANKVWDLCIMINNDRPMDKIKEAAESLRERTRPIIDPFNIGRE